MRMFSGNIIHVTRSITVSLYWSISCAGMGVSTLSNILHSYSYHIQHGNKHDYPASPNTNFNILIPHFLSTTECPRMATKVRLEHRRLGKVLQRPNHRAVRPRDLGMRAQLHQTTATKQDARQGCSCSRCGSATEVEPINQIHHLDWLAAA